MTPEKKMSTTCCVVGGGPAGMMLGYLLARQGVRVTVLEKHRDFFRAFRGDTVHPATLELFYELGLLDALLRLPHQELELVGGVIGEFRFTAADLRHLPTQCKFVALMPQWDLLNFLAGQARRFEHFDLRMEHEVIGLSSDAGRITGVTARTPEGMTEIHADLVVGCDGRHSVVRDAAQLNVLEFGVPIDVLWFRISRPAGDPEEQLGNVNYGHLLVLINREVYYQAGLIIQKGSFEVLRTTGLEAFRRTIVKIAPYLEGRVQELQSWDQIKLLTVQINRLQTWHRPGLLCIGDAAHAMSPAGGVGINLAIQDAVAAANLLAQPLREGCVEDARLALVQKRRELPTRFTQFLQKNAHRGLSWVFQHPGPLEAPWQVKVVTRVPGIQRVVGRVIGLGLRPEHIAGVRKRRAPEPAAVWRVAACAIAALRHRRDWSGGRNR